MNYTQREKLSSNNSMQRTVLRAAADAERYTKGESMATGLVFYLFEAFGYKDTFHLANLYFYRGHTNSALRIYEKGANSSNP